MVRVVSIVLALALIGLGLWFYRVAEQHNAANPGKQPAPDEPEQVSVVEKDPLSVPAKLLEKWKKPRIALLLTGEQHGYIEPCGCSEEQYGGMARRGDLLRQLKDRDWKVAGIDLGGLVERSNEQAILKFETTVNALNDLGYQAIGLGPEDLRLGPDVLLQMDNPDGLGFVSANVVILDSPELTAAFKVLKVDGVKIGVTSVLGDSFAAKVIPKESTNFPIKQTPPEIGLPPAIVELNKSNPDLMVLLSQASFEETTALISKFPDFDIAVSAGGGEEGKTESSVVGKTIVLRVGQKGKHAGVLGYYPDSADQRFRFELVKLDRHRFGDDPKMIQQMKLYQEQLKSRELANVTDAIPHPSNARFVGAEKCGECHSSAFEVWEKSKHAEAFLSLNPANKGHGYDRLKGIDRRFDPECISCHVTGWDPQEHYRYQSGFINEEFATTDALKEMFHKLRGSQCESCHGPGSLHIERIDQEEGLAKDAPAAGRESVRVSKEQARDNVCNKCHDLDNSPKFEFEEYWPQVVHGLDE